MQLLDSSQIIHAMGDAVVVTDTEFNIMFLNEAAEAIYQLKFEEVSGQSIVRLIQYEYLQGGQDEALRQLRENGRWEGEVSLRRSDGSVVHLVSTVNFLLDEAGKRSRIVAVNKDVTELKRERSLRQEAELTTDTILENSGQALFLLNSNYDIIMFNTLSYEVMRSVVQSEIAVGKNLIELLPEYRRPDVKRHLQKVRSGKTVRYQVQYAGGEWLEIQFIPVKRPDGNIFEICTGIRDVTEQKKREERVLRMRVKRQRDLTKATLQGQERERNEIGRELHDNVNQILAAAKLQLNQGMNDPVQNGEMLAKAFSYVQLAIDEVRKLSHQLIAPQFQDEPFIDMVRELVQPFMFRFKVKLQVDEFDEEQTPAEVKLVLYRVLQEQLNNIYRHAEATEALITLQNSKEKTTLGISDNGKGFDRLKKKPGVGLTNIHNRVVSINGRAKLQTAPQQGCRIYIEIPTGGASPAEQQG